MTADMELETWQQEWREGTEPLPEWKRKIKRQNRWVAATTVVLGICLSLSTLWALQARTSFVMGLTAGIWLTTVLACGYVWCVRREVWKPSAQTTLAYMELAHRRAIAKARQLQFSCYLLLAATLSLALFSVWDSKARGRNAAIIVALGIESVCLRYYERRKRREIEQTKELIDDMKE